MEIIEITSSEDEADYAPPPPRVNKGKGKVAVNRRPYGLRISDATTEDSDSVISIHSEPGPSVVRSTSPMSIDQTLDVDPLAQVLDIVPDVDPNHAQELIERHRPNYGDKVVEAVLHALFEDRSYPKVTKKRKSAAPEPGPSKRARMEDAVDYTSTEREHRGGPYYADLAIEQLMLDYPTIRKPDLRRLLESNNGFYVPTFLWLKAQMERGVKVGDVLKAPRAVTKGKRCAREDIELEVEIEWLARQSRHSEPAVIPDEEAEEGEGIECGCCFSDYPFSKMVQCPEAHLFCSDCFKQYAETQLGGHDVKLVCMDQSGCKAPFPDSELKRLLSDKLWDLYERLKQRKDIEAAGLDNLEECPLCDYKCVIDNPDEKLFRCGNEETCGAVTCRQCKKADHLPKTCKEMEEDKHLDGRHAVEEAMTAALVRNCPKCTRAFMKEAGCNKMLCPNCNTLSCYICREIIKGYEHFNQNLPAGHPQQRKSSSSKCMLWDNVESRHADEVKAAAKLAQERYRAENPDVEEDDLHVDLPPNPPPPPAPAPYRGGGMYGMGVDDLFHYDIGFPPGMLARHMMRAMPPPAPVRPAVRAAPVYRAPLPAAAHPLYLDREGRRYHRAPPVLPPMPLPRPRRNVPRR
ncbi:hypothetical protein CYLTODRAFT_416193 [Cylindrobasidium torrendii FP15055 ss-10]|uniref:RING-type domain-containing protein n=1 Tax=Cylindrobasidium torrendii FP15055 ss-10 TaxID=1314674 RepID=A0A0D7BVS9_9AGAR|nr:hypothetical protein CYLTODRAFT_416193 [Cylindrobasidium torrendii FP15055 ss-10]